MSGGARLRAIFVGVGGRGRVHLDGWTGHPRLQVTGVVDNNAQHLESAVASVGLPSEACFRSLPEALAGVEADAVVIVTHAQSHGYFIGEAIAAGKHVMVEKPLTTDLAEAEELVRLAEESGVRLMVTQQVRYLPVERTMRRLLAEDAYGRPGFGHYIAYKARGSAYPPSDHMHLWQMSVHELDALIAMIGRPVVRVSAREFQPSWGDWPSESTISAVIEFESGPTISYLSSSDARAFKHEFRLECERGALIHRAPRVGGQGGLSVATRDGEVELPRDEGMAPGDVPRAMADLFAAYALDGVEPEVSGRNNLATMRLCDAIIRSSALAGAAVDLHDETATPPGR